MRVTRFSIAPVRSLALVHPVEIDLIERGMSEDRRFLLIDDADRLGDRLIVGRLAVKATRLRLEVADGSVVDAEGVRVGDELTVSATVPPGAIGWGGGTTLDAEDGRGVQ
jgi:uncharacterized protein YcbX